MWENFDTVRVYILSCVQINPAVVRLSWYIMIVQKIFLSFEPGNIFCIYPDTNNPLTGWTKILVKTTTRLVGYTTHLIIIQTPTLVGHDPSSCIGVLCQQANQSSIDKAGQFFGCVSTSTSFASTLDAVGIIPKFQGNATVTLVKKVLFDYVG